MRDGVISAFHETPSGDDHQHHSWNLLWAVNTAAAAVARADGRVHSAERLALRSYLQRSHIPDLASPLGRGLFDKCVRELERDPASARRALACVLAGFDGTPWAWVILRAAEHVAAADGDVRQAEIDVVDTIRTMLDVPRGVPERYAACALRPGRL